MWHNLGLYQLASNSSRIFLDSTTHLNIKALLSLFACFFLFICLFVFKIKFSYSILSVALCNFIHENNMRPVKSPSDKLQSFWFLDWFSIESVQMKMRTIVYFKTNVFQNLQEKKNQKRFILEMNELDEGHCQQCISNEKLGWLFWIVKIDWEMSEPSRIASVIVFYS